MEQVRLGFVGVGFGTFLAKAINNNPRAQVVAVCDLLEDRMQAFSDDVGTQMRFYTDYHEMCRDPEVDAVFIGTPNQWHVPIGLEAIRNDKHVLTTKPLADAIGPAREIVAAAESSGVVNMMSLSTRFSNEARYLGKLALRGELGDVYYARARSVRRSGIPDWSAGFVMQGGGAFRDVGVHVLDTAWWMMGMPRPVSISGVGGAKFGPRGQGYWDFRTPTPDYVQKFAADDYAGGFVRFENGAGLQVESFWASHQPNELQIDLFGTEAGARLRPLTLFRTIDNAPVDSAIDLPKGPDVWDSIAAHFVECILDGVPCEAPLRHGLIVQEMLEALLESAENGREVDLSHLPE